MSTFEAKLFCFVSFIPAMAAVDKTAAILSTLYGLIPDETQLEVFREHLRAACFVRDVPFAIHEVSMRATSTAGAPGMQP